jgi:peptidoglycan/xylan/chitin deacetylase (PgdA/CDA1 family)
MHAKGILAGGALGLAASYWTMMSPYSQLLGPFPYRRTTTGKLVALTFDDGPNEPYTSQIVDFLNERNIKATFFQVGRCVERHPGLTAKMAGDGHVIGAHTYSHEFHKCLTRRSIRAEVTRSQAVLREALGVEPALFRPPWLLRTPALFTRLRNSSLQPVSGEFCHPLEVFQPRAGRIARGAVAKVRPGSIIIFHDGFDARGGDRSQTVAATKLVVQRLSAAGYDFTTVDKLLGVPAYHPDAAPAPTTETDSGPR